MSNVQLGSERAPHDLTHFVYSTGRVGNLKVLSHTYVLPGDSVEIDAVGAFRLSPLRRGLAVDSKVELFSFYVPFRYNYGNDNWNAFLLAGVDEPAPLVAGWSVEESAVATEFVEALGIHNWAGLHPAPFPLADSYLKIWNRFFRVPTEPEAKWNYATLGAAWTGLGAFDVEKAAGFGCAMLKTPWSASLPEDTRTSYDTHPGAALDLMKLNQDYAKLHTEQERTHFMRYYADVVESMGGKASRDSEQRPYLLSHTEFWASGYDVDGTASDNLGQFSGRVQQSFRHEVPRFFVPEHGQIITLALCRFPPTIMGETDYIDTMMGNGSVTYDLLAGDSAIVANSPPVEVPTGSVVPGSFNTPTFKLPHSWYYRYQPSRVSEKFRDIEGFPFIDPRDFPEGWNPRYSIPALYESVFQTQQLDDWNIQSKFNIQVLRDLPSTRDSIMTS